MINYEDEYNNLCNCYRKQQGIIKELLGACKMARDYLQFNKGNASPIYDQLEQVITKAENKG